MCWFKRLAWRYSFIDIAGIFFLQGPFENIYFAWHSYIFLNVTCVFKHILRRPEAFSVYICMYYQAVSLSICLSVYPFPCVTPTICLPALKSVLQERDAPACSGPQGNSRVLFSLATSQQSSLQQHLVTQKVTTQEQKTSQRQNCFHLQ